MKQFFLILKVLFVYFMLVTAVLAKESDYFKKGKELFQMLKPMGMWAKEWAKNF